MQISSGSSQMLLHMLEFAALTFRNNFKLNMFWLLEI